MHTKTWLAVALLILAFIGIADSWYLAQSAYTGSALTCDISALDGCNTVAQSPYGRLFGIPLGTYGVAFYALVFALAAAELALPRVKQVRRGLWLLGIGGSLASVAFIGVQVFLIHALCIYCLGSAVITFVMAWCGDRLYRRPDGVRTAHGPVVEPW